MALIRGLSALFKRKGFLIKIVYSDDYWMVDIGNHVFRNGECATNPPIGCPPDPYEAGDVNCDEAVNIGDAVYLGNVIFRPGSPGPCAACP